MKPTNENWVKIHKVIHSCKTKEQLDIALKWCIRYIRYLYGGISYLEPSVAIGKRCKMYRDERFVIIEYKLKKGEIE